MSSYKFIHAADLHIESPYRGVTSMNKQLGNALINHGIQAYENLIETCIREAVDFLLIAGDSFDSESGSLGSQYRFFRGLERLNEHQIAVYIICGNHDPLNRWAKNFRLPENVTRFEADTIQHVEFSKGNNKPISIYGVSFGEKEEYRNLSELFERKDTNAFAIGMLHGTLAGSDAHTPYCPFSMNDLRASKMDYWALGHIHKREIVNERNPMVVYPGNLQGRHFNESGEKGCMLISLENGAVKEQQFLPLSNVVFHTATQDATELHSISDLFQQLEELRRTLLTSDKSYMLRINFTGMTDLYPTLTNQLELKKVIETFNAENNYHQPFVYLDRIINSALPNINLEERRLSADFIGDVIQRFEGYEGDNAKSSQLTEEIWEEINATKVGRFLTPIVNEEEIAEILNRAKWKCVTALITQSEAS
jgi:DNA repair exonuclease SbcCD nuclease subunit